MAHQLSFQDLFAPVRDLASGDALHDWRWLIGEDCKPLLLTAMGDLFVLRPEKGATPPGVVFLDTCSGTAERVADSYDHLKELLQDLANIEVWLLPDLVADLADRGEMLTEGQCYSAKHPPVLGGPQEADNYEPVDWRVHIGLAGQIHRQLRDVAPGTPVNSITIR